MDKLGVYGYTAVAGIVAIVLVATAAAILIPLTQEGAARIGIVIGLVTPTLTALIVLLRTDAANNKIDLVKEQVNGHVEKHAETVQIALDTLRSSKLTVEDAALIAAQVMQAQQHGASWNG